MNEIAYISKGQQMGWNHRSLDEQSGALPHPQNIYQ